MRLCMATLHKKTQHDQAKPRRPTLRSVPPGIKLRLFREGVHFRNQ